MTELAAAGLALGIGAGAFLAELGGHRLAQAIRSWRRRRRGWSA
jgi:hypothetical protein